MLLWVHTNFALQSHVPNGWHTCHGIGYWNNPVATKEAFLPNGWLRTGDRFRLDKKGSFWFEDRTKVRIPFPALL